MKMTLVRTAVVCAVALGAAGCSMFRDGEAPPPEAALHGDRVMDGDGLTVADVVAAAAGAPMLRGDAAGPSAGRADPVSPAIAARSVLYGIHLASYRSETSAEAGWRILSSEAPAALDGLHPRVQSVDLGPERGVYLRLKAGPLDSRADAAARCAALVQAGHYCQAIDFAGWDIVG